MKHLKTFEKYYVKGNNLYHYTSLENAIKIVEDNLLKRREMSLHNKYGSGLRSEDYGYISFTENDEYHENTSSEIPCECRFVFNISKLEKDYELDKHDANLDEIEDYKNRYEYDDLDDLDYQEISYYGDEMELRIYEKDVPLKKYVNRIEISFESEELSLFEKLINLCKERGIKCVTDVY